MEFSKPVIDPAAAEKFGREFIVRLTGLSELIAASDSPVIDEVVSVMGLALATASEIYAIIEQVKQLAEKVQEGESTARVDRLLAYLELLQGLPINEQSARIKAVCAAIEAELGISVLKAAE